MYALSGSRVESRALSSARVKLAQPHLERKSPALGDAAAANSVIRLRASSAVGGRARLRQELVVKLNALFDPFQ